MSTLPMWLCTLFLQKNLCFLVRDFAQKKTDAKDKTNGSWYN